MAEKYSLWDKLTKNDRPIFLYGTGNGADKIIENTEKYGIKISGIFASDEYVRDRYFHSMKVRPYSEIITEYGNDITVLLAFGTTLPSVYNFICELDKRHELIIPDVPLYGGELFDMNYYLKHSNILDETRALLEDDRSKKIFDDAVNFRLTGKLQFLTDVSEHRTTLKEIFGQKEFELLIDAGAFTGDSTKTFADVLNVKKIIAVEADPKTFAKLNLYADSEHRVKVETINAAVWDSECTVKYISSSSRGSGKAGKNRRAKEAEVQALTIDSIVKNETADYIKLDIEGAEMSALNGAIKTISQCKPNIEISLYHRTDDLFEIPLKLHALLPDHKLYLRRIPCVPLWDLTLYAVQN